MNPLIKGLSREQLAELLIHAVANDDVAAARTLLDAGADIDGIDTKSERPVHLAASLGHSAVCAFLIGRGARLNGLDRSGRMPLHAAALRGRLVCCELLINAFADVNGRTSQQGAPLHNACSSGNAEVVSLLLSSGADISARDDDGLSPLHYAAMFSPLETCRTLVALGLSASELPAIAGRFRMTPFQRAVETGREEVVEYFIVECGESVSQLAPDGRTMEQLANGEDAVIEILRSASAQAIVNSALRVEASNAARRNATFDPM